MATEVIEKVEEAAPIALPDLKVVETERDAFARNRDRIAQKLRADAGRQIRGSLRNKEGGVCFVGCAVEAIRDLSEETRGR